MAITPASAALDSPHLRTGIAQPWRSELGGRVRKHLALTLIGTSAFVFVFFIGYFYVQQHPTFAAHVMPLTPLDDLIPFQPYALVPYLSLWIYVGAGPGLQESRGDILVYTLWMSALCVTGLAFFYFLPTQMPPVVLAGSDSIFFRTLQQVDASSNACPSMHVAAAIFTVIRVADVLRATRAPMLLRLLNMACCGVICYSTLAIKQHVVLDVAAGALLGAAFAWLSRLQLGNAYAADHERTGYRK